MRLDTIDICKGIAIILMVMGHTDCEPFGRMIYEFHMPLFFICAGYFFSVKYLNDEATFVKKRIKGLYWPFLKWSLFFLCIHNLMFEFDLLNEVHGNPSGGVLHPYTWEQFEQRVWSCVFNMSGYDEFLTGAFWFFRALFTSSIAFLVLFKLFKKVKWLRDSDFSITMAIMTVAFMLALWHTLERLNMTGVSQNGYRDIMGLFFFAIGFAFRQKPQWLKVKWWGALLCLGIVVAASEWFSSSMIIRASLEQLLYLPVPAVAGFLMTYWLSEKIARRDNAVHTFLAYCGRNTVVVYVFHTIAFKIVGAVKIWYYDIDWTYIGGHMTVQYETDDLFWIPYTITAVGVPLLWKWCYDKAKTKLLLTKNA